MKNKLLGYGLVASMTVGTLVGCAQTEVLETESIPQEQVEESVTTEDVLAFPIDVYTEEEVTVKTSEGEKVVTYRYYQHLTYVANPVDPAYQSLNVKVPVAVDGEAIDVSNAPILFINSVGGYMSSANYEDVEQNTFTEDIIQNETSASETDASSTASETQIPKGEGNGPEGAMSGAVKKGDGGARNNGDTSGNSDLALAAGYVVVEAGARGRDNQAEDGTYYGKVPAAIVDLKAAIRYIRYNDDIMPGNADWIISTGVSAGGALSALLGASGNSDLYEPYLAELGAADADDSIFATAAFCPILDLEHADMAYEWMFGTTAINGSLVDQDISTQLAELFVDYIASLNLEGQDDFGLITADNYGEYMVEYYLVPAANAYLAKLGEEELTAYLSTNSWITWDGTSASFTFEDYVANIGRSKYAPAFDTLDLSGAENGLFGDETTDAKHFTAFGIENSTVVSDTELDAELVTLVNMMNPMYFIGSDNSDVSQHWWIRYGTRDTNTALSVIINLATSLENAGADVDTSLYWNAGHGSDQDPEQFIEWISTITGYTTE